MQMHSSENSSAERVEVTYTAPMLAFERGFNSDELHSWVKQNWSATFVYAVVYVILIFLGRGYMANRSRFELRLPLIIWNSLLAVFSITGAVRSLPDLIHMLRNYGFEASVCSPPNFNGPTAFWSYAFAMSKLFELGDTAFIVLRKQPLIFLHWYHHITVMIYVWICYVELTGPARWYMVMNYVVHSFMYTYYAFRAMKCRIPRWISVFVTCIQISQMALGLAVNFTSYRVKSQPDRFCQQTDENLKYSTIMYLSYFVLFAHFFYSTYIKPPKTKISVERSKSSKNGAIVQFQETENNILSASKKHV